MAVDVSWLVEVCSHPFVTLPNDFCKCVFLCVVTKVSVPLSLQSGSDLMKIFFNTGSSNNKKTIAVSLNLLIDAGVGTPVSPKGP